jgi:hypothetical protein
VPRQNGVSTVRFKISLDAMTDKLLQSMVPLGLHGKNKSEVASWVIREWIWHNQDKLALVGVRIVESKRANRSRS